MIRVVLNEIDISELISSITWSGNCDNISRTLDVKYLYAVEDYYTPKNYPNLGDTIYFYCDDVELFRGKIYAISNNGSQGTIDLTCYDDSIKLGQSSGTFNFKNVSAETITTQVLNEVDIPIGELAQTKIQQKKLYDNENLYSILRESYENASLQNGKNYINYMHEGKFYVVETGTHLGITLDDEKDITSVSFSEDASNIVTRVKIYDENQQYMETVEDSELISKFGIFQAIYTKEEDKQAKTVAKEMLKDIEQTISIFCLGNYNCRSGYCVTVLEKKTNLDGNFHIDSDSHTWENGQYTMSLELTYRGDLDE